MSLRIRRRSTNLEPGTRNREPGTASASEPASARERSERHGHLGGSCVEMMWPVG
jgi:hypothetical protein